MKDYLFAITDLAAFNVMLEEYEVALNVTMATLAFGNTAVTTVRMDTALLVELNKFSDAVLVGEAKHKYIESNNDVRWSDENLYHSMYNVQPVTFTNEEGEEVTNTPPKIHRVFA